MDADEFGDLPLVESQLKPTLFDVVSNGVENSGQFCWFLGG